MTKNMYSRNGIWYSRITDASGKQIRKRLSRDKSTAMALVAEMRKTFEYQRAGLLPEVIPEQIKKLSDLRNKYEDHLKSGKVADNTVTSFLTAWSQVIEKNKLVFLSQLNMQVIEDWSKNKLREGTRGQTINTYMIHVLMALKWALGKGFIRVNPLADWRKVRINEPRKRRDLKSSEVQAIMQAETDEEWRLRWIVYFFTGLRNEAGACINLKWIDWDAKILTIPPENNKSRRPLDIPLHPALFSALKEWRLSHPPAESGAVFRHVTTRSISRRFNEICRRAGIDTNGVTLHSVRHTYATMVYEGSGKNIKVVQELLGHANAATTMRYLHITEVERVQAVHALDYGIGAEQ